MKCASTVIAVMFLSFVSFPLAYAKSRRSADCTQFHINGRDSDPLGSVITPSAGRCHTRTRNGFPVPDPDCTPGAFNPTVTLDVLRSPGFRTGCVRQTATTEKEKAATYEWYGIDHPTDNHGPSQTCELDHLVPLELGGADTLDNIWPQCGPPGVPLHQRYFKQKDIVENYLAWRVRHGEMDLMLARKGIANDWTQYLADATRHCHSGRCQ